jgi:hypothetical protein
MTSALMRPFMWQCKFLVEINWFDFVCRTMLASEVNVLLQFSWSNTWPLLKETKGFAFICTEIILIFIEHIKQETSVLKGSQRGNLNRSIKRSVPLL